MKDLEQTFFYLCTVLRIHLATYLGNMSYGKSYNLTLAVVRLLTMALSRFICNKIWIWAAEGKTLLTPRHSLNAFSEARPSRTLELVEASKN